VDLLASVPDGFENRSVNSDRPEPFFSKNPIHEKEEEQII